MSRRDPEGRSAASRLLIGVVALAGAMAGAMGCTEEALVGPPPEGSEGAETVELLLDPADMVSWTDTTFVGYAAAADAGFLLLSADSVLDARTLLKFEGVPDSVTIDSVRHAVEAYEDVRIRFLTDTTRSAIPDDSLQLRLFGLEQDWEPGEVTWSLAAEGRPWAREGGDLTRELGQLTLTQNPDSALAASAAVPVPDGVGDSLLDAWSRDRGGRGAALLAEGENPRIRVTGAGLEALIRPSGVDTVIPLRLSRDLRTEPSTFIHDPPAPDSVEGLRLGGLPAHRFYFTFRPPDTIEGVPLREASVNQAELVFRPMAAPAPPFALEEGASAGLLQLASDPFESGPETPMIRDLGGRSVNGDSLASGKPLRFGFTGLMRQWASSPDTVDDFHLGVRMTPDAQSLGFWSFGSAEDSAAVRPFLRLLVTPPAPFGLP